MDLLSAAAGTKTLILVAYSTMCLLVDPPQCIFVYIPLAYPVHNRALISVHKGQAY